MGLASSLSRQINEHRPAISELPDWLRGASSSGFRSQGSSAGLVVGRPRPTLLQWITAQRPRSDRWTHRRVDGKTWGHCLTSQHHNGTNVSFSWATSYQHLVGLLHGRRDLVPSLRTEQPAFLSLCGIFHLLGQLFVYSPGWLMAVVTCHSRSWAPLAVLLPGRDGWLQLSCRALFLYLLPHPTLPARGVARN